MKGQEDVWVDRMSNTVDREEMSRQEVQRQRCNEQSKERAGAEEVECAKERAHSGAQAWGEGGVGGGMEALHEGREGVVQSLDALPLSHEKKLDGFMGRHGLRSGQRTQSNWSVRSPVQVGTPDVSGNVEAQRLHGLVKVTFKGDGFLKHQVQQANCQDSYCMSQRPQHSAQVGSCWHMSRVVRCYTGFGTRAH